MVSPSMAEKTRSSIAALTAEGRQPQNTVCKRNAIKNLPELAPIRIAVQTHEVNMLAMRVHCPLDKRHKMRKELRLVNNNDLVRCNVHLVEVARMDTRGGATIVRCNDALTIPLIGLVRNDQNGNTQYAVSRYNGQDVGALPREHGTNDHV